jgi:hypothetical protein
MALSRYSFTSQIIGRTALATSKASSRINNACDRGILDFSPTTLKEGQRLEHIAASAYGSSSLWWIIAAASGIGWGLQVPPGTLLRVPTNISAVLSLLR